MRPSSKYILTNHATESAQKTETTSNNSKVQSLMKDAQSCGTCTHFPASTILADVRLCAHPHQQPPQVIKKKKVRHYNICHLHIEKVKVITS